MSVSAFCIGVHKRSVTMVTESVFVVPLAWCHSRRTPNKQQAQNRRRRHKYTMKHLIHSPRTLVTKEQLPTSQLEHHWNNARDRCRQLHPIPLHR
eukprot:scaffold8991_cov155-Skeletonema_dohrnii-CCMP3373.AAC.10